LGKEGKLAYLRGMDDETIKSYPETAAKNYMPKAKKTDLVLAVEVFPEVVEKLIEKVEAQPTMEPMVELSEEEKKKRIAAINGAVKEIAEKHEDWGKLSTTERDAVMKDAVEQVVEYRGLDIIKVMEDGKVDKESMDLVKVEVNDAIQNQLSAFGR